jgi:ABC-type uncharacterized transport system fused permease/ATPase subunit
VAFYGGVAKEGELIRLRFEELAKHRTKLLAAQWKFGIVQDFFLKYCGATVAVVLIIGPFFSGVLRPEGTIDGRAQMLSNMRYHTSVVISLFSALGTLGELRPCPPRRAHRPTGRGGPSKALCALFPALT